MSRTRYLARSREKLWGKYLHVLEPGSEMLFGGHAVQSSREVCAVRVPKKPSGHGKQMSGGQTFATKADANANLAVYDAVASLVVGSTVRSAQRTGVPSLARTVE